MSNYKTICVVNQAKFPDFSTEGNLTYITHFYFSVLCCY